MTATERFKRLLADALERVCVLEAELEQARERIAELEQARARIAELEAHAFPDGVTEEGYAP